VLRFAAFSGSIVSVDKGSGEPPRPQQADGRAIRKDEGHRIARELHDSTSQDLVVLQLELGRLKRVGTPRARPLIAECEAAISELRQAIRDLDLD
jgi:signal transduction histidine kinase